MSDSVSSDPATEHLRGGFLTLLPDFAGVDVMAMMRAATESIASSAFSMDAAATLGDHSDIKQDAHPDGNGGDPPGNPHSTTDVQSADGEHATAIQSADPASVHGTGSDHSPSPDHGVAQAAPYVPNTVSSAPMAPHEGGTPSAIASTGTSSTGQVSWFTTPGTDRADHIHLGVAGGVPTMSRSSGGEGAKHSVTEAEARHGSNGGSEGHLAGDVTAERGTGANSGVNDPVDEGLATAGSATNAHLSDMPAGQVFEGATNIESESSLGSLVTSEADVMSTVSSDLAQLSSSMPSQTTHHYPGSVSTAEADDNQAAIARSLQTTTASKMLLTVNEAIASSPLHVVSGSGLVVNIGTFVGTETGAGVIVPVMGVLTSISLLSNPSTLSQPSPSLVSTISGITPVPIALIQQSPMVVREPLLASHPGGDVTPLPSTPATAHIVTPSVVPVSANGDTGVAPVTISSPVTDAPSTAPASSASVSLPPGTPGMLTVINSGVVGLPGTLAGGLPDNPSSTVAAAPVPASVVVAPITIVIDPASAASSAGTANIVGSNPGSIASSLGGGAGHDGGGVSGQVPSTVTATPVASSGTVDPIAGVLEPIPSSSSLVTGVGPGVTAIVVPPILAAPEPAIAVTGPLSATTVPLSVLGHDNPGATMEGAATATPNLATANPAPDTTSSVSTSDSDGASAATPTLPPTAAIAAVVANGPLDAGAVHTGLVQAAAASVTASETGIQDTTVTLATVAGSPAAALALSTATASVDVVGGHGPDAPPAPPIGTAVENTSVVVPAIQGMTTELAAPGKAIGSETNPSTAAPAAALPASSPETAIPRVGQLAESSASATGHDNAAGITPTPASPMTPESSTKGPVSGAATPLSPTASHVDAASVAVSPNATSNEPAHSATTAPAPSEFPAANPPSTAVNQTGPTFAATPVTVGAAASSSSNATATGVSHQVSEMPASGPPNVNDGSGLGLSSVVVSATPLIGGVTAVTVLGHGVVTSIAGMVTDPILSAAVVPTTKAPDLAAALSHPVMAAPATGHASNATGSSVIASPSAMADTVFNRLPATPAQHLDGVAGPERPNGSILGVVVHDDPLGHRVTVPVAHGAVAEPAGPGSASNVHAFLDAISAQVTHHDQVFHTGQVSSWPMASSLASSATAFSIPEVTATSHNVANPGNMDQAPHPSAQPSRGPTGHADLLDRYLAHTSHVIESSRQPGNTPLGHHSEAQVAWKPMPTPGLTRTYEATRLGLSRQDGSARILAHFGHDTDSAHTSALQLHAGLHPSVVDAAHALSVTGTAHGLGMLEDKQPSGQVHQTVNLAHDFNDHHSVTPLFWHHS